MQFLSCLNKVGNVTTYWTFLPFQQVKGQHSLFTRKKFQRRVLATTFGQAFATLVDLPTSLWFWYLVYSILKDTWGPLSAWFSRVLLKQRVLHIIIATLLPRFGGDSKDGLLQRLCAAAMAFEGTIVVASSLCSPGAGVLRHFAVFSCVYRMILDESWVFIKSSERQ